MTRLASVLVAATVLGSFAACGDDDTEPQVAVTTTTTTTTVPHSADFAGLCGAIAAVGAGDLGAMITTFDHGPLHELAEATTEVDRSLAARLLEAKQKVEADTTDPSTTPEQALADLEALAVATRDAQRATGVDELAPCPEETTQ